MKVILAAIFLLVSSVAFTDDLNYEPPGPQEGDDEVVETTVGAMRLALWYYDMFPLMRQRIADLKDERDRWKAESKKTLDLLLDAEDALTCWRVISVGLGLIFTASTVLLILK